MEDGVGSVRNVGVCWVNHGGCGGSGAVGVRGKGLGGGGLGWKFGQERSARG